MVKAPRPLWQLLLLSGESNKAISLTCEECIELLEYDADLLIAGVNLEDINPSISHHIELCSSCRSLICSWLKELEGNKKTSSSNEPFLERKL